LNNSKGFSLIEVLVTLLLTTLGILGMVALQSRSIHYTQDSIQRNSAVELSSQLIDMMRANPAALFDEVPPKHPTYGKLKNSSLFFKTKGNNFSPAPAEPASNACLTPTTAQQQRDCWIAQVKNRLPDGAALLTSQSYVCRSSVAGNCNNQGSTIEIQLAWQVKKDSCPDARAPNATTCIYRTRIEL
jgi:type IV pilus assembly protein PilV|tara:strand:+ start:126 stop:686 length:561 start_codon:yes stop_codon:yes gene_type:complete